MLIIGNILMLQMCNLVVSSNKLFMVLKFVIIDGVVSGKISVVVYVSVNWMISNGILIIDIVIFSEQVKIIVVKKLRNDLVIKIFGLLVIFLFIVLKILVLLV